MILILLITVCFGLWWLWDRKQYIGAPPGPFRLPFIGNIIQVATASSIPALAFYKLSRVYGDVISLRLGMVDFVVCSSYESITEMMSISSKRFVFPFFLDRNKNKNLGIMTSYGDAWSKMRRYTIRTLREFGFGKSLSMGPVLNEEVDKFVTYFKNQIDENEVLFVDGLFDVSVVNVLWRLVTGKSHELDDSRMMELIRLSREYEKNISVTDASIAFPFLRVLFPSFMGKFKQIECVRKLTCFLEELVDEFLDNGDYVGNPKNFIDAFLYQIHLGEDQVFSREQLVYTLMDLFQGGSETTSKTLTFAILYMIKYPDVQEKVFCELENALQIGEPITLEMKQMLPYTHATLLEIMRFSCVVPIPGPLECPSDINFRGFKIKKGTPVMLNLHGSNVNEDTWGDPLSFRPDRFLDDLNGKKSGMILTFGGGKRVCPGQIFAEANLFVYFATLMRLFKFGAKGDVPSIRPTLGLTYSPVPFFVRVIERSA